MELNNKILANKNFVNDRFTKYHGRDANQNELNQFSGKGLVDVDSAIKAGSPQKTAPTPTAPTAPEPPKVESVEDLINNLPSSANNDAMKQRLENGLSNANNNKAQAEKELSLARKMYEVGKATDEKHKELEDIQTNTQNELDEVRSGKQGEITDMRLDTQYNITKAFSVSEEEALKTKENLVRLNDNLGRYTEDYINAMGGVGHAGQTKSQNALEMNKVHNTYGSLIALTESQIANEKGLLNYSLDIIDRAGQSFMQRNEELKSSYSSILAFNEYAENNKKEEFNLLDNEQKELFKGYIADLEQEQANIEANKDTIKNLMANKETAKIASEAGINLTDSEEEVAKKLQEYYINNPDVTEELSFEQKLKLYEKGLMIDTNGNIKETPVVYDTNLSIGNATITGLNGSKYWEWGLDLVINGGKGAGVETPFAGEVIFAGENGGFGNQVKIRIPNYDENGNPVVTGNEEEIWLSHLDSINVKEGDFVNSYDLVGKQGNSGNVYSESGGDGTHLDVTVKKGDGSFYQAKEVAELLGFKGENQGRELTSLERLQAENLTEKITKNKGTTERKDKIRADIEELMKSGKTLDEIEDSLRYSDVSSEFAGEYKGAFEYITKAGFSTQERENARDGLDELLQAGDTDGAEDYILGLARDKATADEKKQVAGREDGMMMISEIKNDLDDYINSGGDTGLLTGAVENFKQGVLKRTGDEKLAEIANKISITIQAYRKSISGAAFTESESKEYERIFPSIGNSPELNEARINSLLQTYQKYQSLFYQRTMGVDNYEALFGSQEALNNDPLGMSNDDPLGLGI
jgi:murein DD-endopeptidase MepM/ murein hydrolase activator NlpD